MQEDIEFQAELDSLQPPDFMKDIEGLSLSVPTIAGLVFGLTAFIIAIVAAAMLGQFYRTQLNRNSNTNEDIAALQALVDSILPLPPRTGRFSDAEFRILNFENLNKSFCFDAGNLTSGQKRLYTTPDKHGILGLTKQIPTDIAPHDPTFLTISLDPILINERSLEFNTSLFQVNDAGPGNAYTVDMVPTPAFVTNYNRANVTLDSKGRVIFAVTNLDPNTTIFFDTDFRIFDEANNLTKAAFFVGNLNVTSTVTMAVQDASGTIAYLGDLPTTFLDNAFAIQNAIDSNKQMMLDCSGITAGFTRTMTAQDLDGTIAYLSDIPSLPFLDSEFGIKNSVQPTKQGRFSAANIAISNTRVYDFPNMNGVLALTSGAQIFSNKTIQGTTNLVEVSHLGTTGLPVNVKNAAPPAFGDFLVAQSAASANWQSVPFTNAATWNPTLSDFVGFGGGSVNVILSSYQQVGTRVYATLFFELLGGQAGGDPYSLRTTLPVPRTSGPFSGALGEGSGTVMTSGIQILFFTPFIQPITISSGIAEPVAGTLQMKVDWTSVAVPGPSGSQEAIIFVKFMYNLL